MFLYSPWLNAYLLMKKDWKLNIMQEKIDGIVKRLIELGEDPAELGLWQKLFPDLETEEQVKLIKNLEDELKQLVALKNKSG